MIDREQAIAAVTEVHHRQGVGHNPVWNEQAADAVLALPDPVHEAAREVAEAGHHIIIQARSPEKATAMNLALQHLDAALADERVPNEQVLRAAESRASNRTLLAQPERVPVPITDEMVERAAKALYEGGDQFGRKSQATWEEMLTYGGHYPGNTDHPLADQYRRMARASLDAALNGES